MTRVLGYHKFAAQGGDWGAAVATLIGQKYPSSASGIHLNLLVAPREKVLATSEAELRYNERLAHFLTEETGYQQIQGTKPQTLAFALTDSTAGLAAWIAEKFRTWSDNDGLPESAISRDRLLANISLYWFTGAIGSSFWPYYGRLHGGIPISPPITVPAGYAAFPKEIIVPPRSLAEKIYTNIQRWTEMEKGGHFAAMEQPAALATEIQSFFRPLRYEWTDPENRHITRSHSVLRCLSPELADCVEKGFSSIRADFLRAAGAFGFFGYGDHVSLIGFNR